LISRKPNTTHMPIYASQPIPSHVRWNSTPASNLSGLS